MAKEKKKSTVEIRNKKAGFEYEFLEHFTAGIVLNGTEIKSIRAGKASLVDSWCYFVNGELYVKNMNVAEYWWGSAFSRQDPRRDRKLLLTKRELRKLQRAVKEKGLTIVATATSLPELITSVVAALKKNSGIAIGNVLGSNIMNIFMVLGVSALITPLPFDPKMNQELMILFAANILMLLFVFTGKGRKISRWEGAFLTLGYVGFMWFSLVMQ